MNLPTVVRLAVAAALVALALGALVGGQDADLDREAYERSPELPVVPADPPLWNEALALHAPVWVPDSPTAPPWLACVATEVLVGDRILALRPGAAGPAEQDTIPETVLAEPRQILDLAGVTDGGAPRLFWTEVGEGAVQIMTSHRREGRWSGPTRVSPDGVRASAPRALRRQDGSVWLTWQQDAPREDGGRDCLDVYAGRLEGDALAEVHRITDRTWSDRHSTLAETADGALWVVWTSCSGRDYEVRARRLAAGAATFEPPLNVSRDTWADDFHPSLAADRQGGLWIAWDRLLDPARGKSDRDPSGIEVSLRLAHVDAQGVQAPALDGGAPGVIPGTGCYTRSGGMPAIGLDGAGRLHVAYRTLDNHALPTFPVCWQVFDGTRFSEPVELENSAGHFDAPALWVGESAVALAYQQHAFRNGRALVIDFPAVAQDSAALAQAGLLLGVDADPEALGIARPPLPPPPATPVTPTLVAAPSRTEARPHALGDVEEVGLLNGSAHHRITAGDHTYQVYWGDLHRHSHVSRCSKGREPAPALAFEMGRDLHLYDFLALTDHSGAFTPFQFWQQAKQLDLYQAAGFCTLQGYEWTSPADGHQNVILRDRLDLMTGSSGKQGRSAQDLWSTLRREAALTIPHHTAHVQMPYDFHNFDPNFVRLVEVFQASRGSYEFAGCFRAGRSALATGCFVHDGLDMGHEFGLIASSDHGNATAYAAVLAESLDREHVFEALAARRTYGATTKGILVDFRVNDHLMGESLRTEQPPRIDLRTQGVSELAEVAVYRNGELLRTFHRPDVVLDREQQFPLEMIVGPRFRAQRDVEIHLNVEEGKFSPRIRMGLANPGPAWFAQRRGREAIWKCPARHLGNYPAHATYLSLSARVLGTITIEGPEGRREARIADVLNQDIPLIGTGDERLALRLHGGLDQTVDASSGMGTDRFEVSFTDDDAPPGKSWYAMRVIQTDREVAWSSPVFVRRD